MNITEEQFQNKRNIGLMKKRINLFNLGKNLNYPKASFVGKII